MPENDNQELYSEAFWQRMHRWLFHAMANVGMGMEGERREDTQRGFWWLNDRRKAWDTPDEVLDRQWVRDRRIEYATEKAKKGRDFVEKSVEAKESRGKNAQNWVWGIFGVIGAALVGYLLKKVGIG